MAFKRIAGLQLSEVIMAGRTRRLSTPLHVILLVALTSVVTAADAQTIYRIWSPVDTAHATDVSSPAECFFRKKFTLIRPELGEIQMTSNDAYELYINSRLVSKGQSFGEPLNLNVASFLQPGTNLIAVRVQSLGSATPSLAMKFRTREQGENRWRSLTTDDTWTTRVEEISEWTQNGYNDMGWLNARKLSEFKFVNNAAGGTPAAGTSQSTAATQNSLNLENNAKLKSLVPAALDGSSGRPSASAPSQVPPNKPVVPFNTEIAQTAPTDGSTPGSNSSSIGQPNNASSSRIQSRTGQTAGQNDVSQPTQKKTNEIANRISGQQEDFESANRFTIDPEFSVQQILADPDTGSVIAMEFNEFGKLIISKEGGPLLIADFADAAEKGKPHTRVLCSLVESCQGILPLNGDVYVTGKGPEGLALYRLSDSDHNGQLEVAQTLLRFNGEPGEHGPHAITLGPDGMLYVITGNASGISQSPSSTSPYLHTFEGDMVPRYEDPGGQSVGVKAPGGTIVRISLDGSKTETVCGGLRNAYDMVFNAHGELFVHDSDMESNIGLAWYRPTRIYHVPDGAEFGWRSGWAKFADYFADVNESAVTTGRGSPTGAVLYQHFQYPARYHNTIFSADWSEGRILAVRETPNGAGFTAESEVFLSGKPLNVTDLAVGEDGALYFCTGGRGTAGGIYRVNWNGTVPQDVLQFENDLEKVVRHPQPQSAWARQNLALIKNKLGAAWGTSLEGVARETRNETQYRVRALDAMLFYGPFPGAQLLSDLAQDPDEHLRARVAQLIGLKSRSEAAEQLATLIEDKSPVVRRRAAESYLRLNLQPELKSLYNLLGSKDKAESLAARRLLERMPLDSWRQQVLENQSNNVFIQGSLAMMTAYPTVENAYDILARISQLLDGFVSDAEFVDLLRATQLALSRSNVDPKQIPAFVEKMVNEFPSGNGIINRQLAMILAYLKPGSLDGRIPEYLKNHSDSQDDKLMVAMYLQTIGASLEHDAFISLIDSLETARSRVAGTTYRAYLSRAINELAQSATDKQIQTILENGARWPNAMVVAFFRLPEQLTSEQIDLVIAADRDLPEPKSPDDLTIRRMRLGTIAVLAQSADEKSMEYLREIWRTRENYRNDIALGLAQKPDEENWAYLVSTIPILDDLTGQEVLRALATVRRRPSQPKPFRDVIELGYRLRQQGAMEASKLLSHWTGQQPESNVISNVSWSTSMDFWNKWFSETWPDETPAKKEPDMTFGKYSTTEVLAYIEQHNAGDAQHGLAVFDRAQCANCHRLGSIGASIGPDLTNLQNRFSEREILQSIVHPSLVISDQYKSKKILTVDGDQYVGMVVQDGSDSFVILDSNGGTTRIASKDVEDTSETSTSAMPEGLLDKLTMDEIANLIKFLTDPQSASRSADAAPESKDTTESVTAVR